MASITKVPRFDVVLEENYPGDNCVNPCAAALYNRMLTTPKDLCSRVAHIFVLRLKSVSCFEHTDSIGGNKELRPGLSEGSAGRAFRSLNECVQTTLQVPSHGEGEVGARTFRVVTGTQFV